MLCKTLTLRITLDNSIANLYNNTNKIVKSCFYNILLEKKGGKLKMKRLLYLFLLVASIFGLAACQKGAGVEVEVTGRTLVEVGEKFELNALLTPKQAGEVTFNWKTSDAKVLTVKPKTVEQKNLQGETVEQILSQTGELEALAVGEAKITVTQGKAKAIHTIKVVEEITEDLKVKSLFMGLDFATVPLSYFDANKFIIGNKFKLNAKVGPNDADQSVIWSSSDETIATVNQKGEVTTHVDGEATIIATAAGNKEITQEFEFEVVKPVEVVGDVEAAINSEFALEANVNDKVNLTEKFTWKSSNPTVATVDEAGKVKALAAGKTVITVTAEGKGKNPARTVSYPLTVIRQFSADQLAGGKDGIEVSFKYAGAEVKAEILAAMERFLINRGASIPLINNSAATLYSDRVTLPTKEYVPLMGFGAIYGVLKDNDKLPYRNYTTGNPKTLNHLQYKDSIESDILTLTELSLFSIEFNEKFDGYVMVASAAQRLAEPVKFNKETEKWEIITDFDVTKDTADAWKISLSDELYWVDSNGTKGRKITVEDFEYTYQMALDPVQANNRANYFYSAAGLPIKNAKKYFEQLDEDGNKQIPAKGVEDGAYETVPWSEVGFHKVDGQNAFIIELEQAFQQWDVHYNMSGFLWAPVYKELFEAGFDKDRKVTSYGSKVENFMSSGPYVLTYWENEKEVRYEKNPHYFYNEGVHKVTPNKISTVIVKDANAAIALYERGELDVVGIPATHYEQYKNNPGLKKADGATSFRFSVNRQTQAESDLNFGVGAWKTKPILQEDDFMWALYFAMDRKTIAEDITKTNTAEQFYFTNAYVVDPLSGQAYRNTEEGKKVATGVFEGDINLSTNTIGYNAALARNYYVKALDSMIAKGVITEGTKKNPVVIEIEIASFDSVTHVAILDFLKNALEENFNAQDKYPNITFKVNTAPQPGMNVYYEKQMKGRYDLAIAGISGGTLDPIGFLEVFCDDNRGGLLLSFGLDTHTPSILLDLDIDGDGVKDGAKYWSFDALYEATAGKVFVKMGVEAKKPASE